MTTIKFYKQKEPFYEFSNFYASKFELDGKKWSTTENYFQATKFDNEEYKEIIRKASTPAKAFYLGGQKIRTLYDSWLIDPVNDRRKVNDMMNKYSKVKIRPDWNMVRDNVMEKCLLAKFTQNETLKALLLSTKNAEIVENSPRDAYWGIGKNGKGTNMLGKLLMKIRGIIGENAKTKICDVGFVINPKTGRCIKDCIRSEKTKKCLKDCKPEKVRNPITGRCKNSKL